MQTPPSATSDQRVPRARADQQLSELRPGSQPDRYDVWQYSRLGVLGVWAAAALPMAGLAWVVAPAVAGHGASPHRFVLTLLVALTAGLIWQAVLVLVLVGRERRDPSWTSLRDRLWLRAPSTLTRRGGRLWWWVLVYALALAALDMLPFGPTGPTDRNFGSFLGSPEGQATFHHAWGLYLLVAVELAFNTFLGEELLFRGTAAAQDAPGVRPGRLDRQRRALRLLPSARALGNPQRNRHRLPLRLPDPQVPQRLDGHLHPLCRGGVLPRDSATGRRVLARKPRKRRPSRPTLPHNSKG